MLARFRPVLSLIAAALAANSGAVAAQPQMADASEMTAPATGVIRLKSAHSFDETLARLKADVEAKGIRFFAMIDQSGLGAQANLKTAPSALVLFGNPPLGVQFLQSNPYAGLDWPVRMLVLEESDGSVWVAWTDFAFIADRYAITDKGPQFKMASEVALSIASAATKR